jgi:hypothetical protein
LELSLRGLSAIPYQHVILDGSLGHPELQVMVIHFGFNSVTVCQLWALHEVKQHEEWNRNGNVLPTCSFVWFAVKYYGSLTSLAPSSSLDLPYLQQHLLQLFGQVRPGGGTGWVGEPRGLNKQAQEMVSHLNCPGRASPGPLTCGLAIEKLALLRCSWERPSLPQPEGRGGEGVALCLLKENSHCGWVTKGSPQGVYLLNPQESHLSLVGGELGATLSQQALSHPGKKAKPTGQPGQTGAWSSPRDEIWTGRIHQGQQWQWVGSCLLCPPQAIPTTPPALGEGAWVVALRVAFLPDALPWKAL